MMQPEFKKLYTFVLENIEELDHEIHDLEALRNFLTPKQEVELESKLAIISFLEEKLIPRLLEISNK